MHTKAGVSQELRASSVTTSLVAAPPGQSRVTDEQAG